MSTLWVRHSAASAATARRGVLAAFDDAGVTGEPALDAALIASELVGNAVRHATPLASGQLAVSWVLDAEGYQISVTDGGPGGPTAGSSAADRVSARQAGAQDTSGRGLRIVAELADSWGVAADDDGTVTVWARAATSA
ncbi:MAG: ATP-binding protein [Jatrophihabitantaceae bacterium]